MLGSLENAGIDWLVFRSKDWRKLEMVLTMLIGDDGTMEGENDDNGGTILTV